MRKIHWCESSETIGILTKSVQACYCRKSAYHTQRLPPGVGDYPLNSEPEATLYAY